MKIDYVIRETGSNIRRNITLTIATVVTVAIALALFGIALLVRQGVDNATARWEGGIEFVRPIRWLVALLDEAVVPLTIAGVTADRVTMSRRGSGVGILSLAGAMDYEEMLLGGEVVVDYSLRLQHEFADRDLWVAAYSNDVMAYIPSRRVLKEGGYEGASSMIYYGLPTVWSENVEEHIIGTVRDLMGQVDRGQ